MLTCLVPVLFTFYIQDVLKLKKNNSGAKGLSMVENDRTNIYILRSLFVQYVKRHKHYGDSCLPRCTVPEELRCKVRYGLDNYLVELLQRILNNGTTTAKCGCRGSSIGIATRYGLDIPRIESRRKRDFPHPSRLSLRPTRPPTQWIPGFSRGLSAAGPLTTHPHLAPRLKKE